MSKSLILFLFFIKLKNAFLKKGIDWCHIHICSLLFMQDNKCINIEVEQWYL